ncbi:MAG: NAD(P)/FAD-dependent oxidoreductase [Cyanothece sp. SIO1E1]|nr:NAD(P)/FAD-dependent oxidoreductase [Cyanothece sp. SIO1E1]
MWDVLVAGAGPAGALAAFVLARAGWQVLLIDEIWMDKYKVGESLLGAARQILQSLDLLSILESGSHLLNYGNVSAWGTDQLVANDFINDPRGLGWHLDRVEFDESLRLAACYAGAVLWRNRVKSVTDMNSIWRIVLKDREVSARWFIDATGRAASLARSQGAIRRRDLPLFATYRWVVASDDDTETRTFVEAVPNGWWYSARLPRQTRVIIFHTDAQKATDIRRQPDLWEVYLEETRYICHLLGGVTYTDSPHVIEAGGGYLNNFAGPQWIVAGDAALIFDPISSQGIFNALYTGMKAGQAVHAALIGDLSGVDAYIERLKAIRAAYCRHYSLIYRSENRWADKSFWALRYKSLV